MKAHGWNLTDWLWLTDFNLEILVKVCSFCKRHHSNSQFCDTVKCLTFIEREIIEKTLKLDDFSEKLQSELNSEIMDITWAKKDWTQTNNIER